MSHFSKGSLYLETIISLSILSIVVGALLPLHIKTLKVTRELEETTKLAYLANYVGNYIFRWVSFDPKSKPLQLDEYQEFQNLELSDERRINQLLWTDPITSELNNITDHYKTLITFHNTVRENSAIIKVKVWYDTNLNNDIDTDEIMYTFSTIVTEKKNL